MKKLFFGSLAIIATGGIYERLSESYIFTRNLRTIRCGLHILYAYKIAFNKDNYLDIHESIAKDIYETCIENDGLYVKFGQGIAAMDHMLPPPFYKHMSKLQDKAKPTSYANIKAVFSEEVGREIEDVFDYFEKQPVASASLAQVHKARLKSGQTVAVKIQKPNIKKQFASDMLMHYLINWVLEKSFDLPLLHFVDDIQLNLKKQLNFEIQAANSNRGKSNFQKLKRTEIYVPKIVQEYTRQRVMVSQWIDGVKITDDQSINKLNFNKKSIMNDLIRAFAEQIFITGFIHCDPHPGNVFVRQHPDNTKKHQIVILDFGLCLEISQKFRLEYAQFWKSLFTQDTEGMKKSCQAWGMKFTDHFASFQLMRPYHKDKLLTEKVDKNDIIRMQMQMKGRINNMMKQTINFPHELLFTSRNMNLVRSLNKHYNGIADRISILANTAYVGTNFKDSQNVSNSVKYYFSSLRFKLSILIMQFLNWLRILINEKDLENIIEDQSIRKTNQMFEHYGFKKIDQSTFNS